MSMLGDLSVVSLTELLKTFQESEKTGQLSVWGANGIHRLLFHKGRIVAGISPDSQYSLKKIFAELKSGSFDIRAKYPSLSEPLGLYLKNKDIVNSATLALAFRKQLQVAIYPLFQLEGGQFRFSDKAPVLFGEMTGLSKNSIEVAVEGLRESQKVKGETDTLPAKDLCFVRVGKEVPILKLSSLEWGLLGNVSEAMSLIQLSQELKSDLLEVQRACSRLSKVGLIEEFVAKQDSGDFSLSDLALDSDIDKGRESLQSVSELPRKKQKSKGGKKPLNANLLNRFASLLKSI